MEARKSLDERHEGGINEIYHIQCRSRAEKRETLDAGFSELRGRGQIP